jgi:hypothetical protein
MTAKETALRASTLRRYNCRDCGADHSNHCVCDTSAGGETLYLIGDDWMRAEDAPDPRPGGTL